MGSNLMMLATHAFPLLVAMAIHAETLPRTANHKHPLKNRKNAMQLGCFWRTSGYMGHFVRCEK